MAKQVIQNSETGEVVRTKLNSNFTELYATVGPGADTIYSATNYIDLRNITGQTAGKQASVAYRTTAGDGGGGVFRWDSSDFSAQVAADTQSGVYVAPTSDVTGASGAWIRVRELSVLRPEWFGATGDGVTDDSTALAALAATTEDNTTVDFGAGTFLVSSSVLAFTNLSGVVLRADGATLKEAAPDAATTYAMIFAGCDDFTIDGFVFDRQNSVHTGVNYKSAISATDCDRLTVRNNRFVDVYNGLDLVNSPYSVFENNYADAPLEYSSERDTAKTIGNLLVNIGDAVSTDGGSHHFVFRGNTVLKMRNAIYNNGAPYTTVSGNVLSGTTDTGIYIVGKGFSITGNTVVRPGKDGIKAISSAVEGDTERGVIGNNYVKHPGVLKADSGAGIVAYGNGIATTGNYVEIDNIINTVYQFPIGIVAGSGSNTSVTSNIIIGPGKAIANPKGIQLYGSPIANANGMLVQGNMVSGFPQGIIHSANATYVLSDISVVGNVLSDVATGVLLGASGKPAANTTQFIIANNQGSSLATGVSLYGCSNGLVTGNMLSGTSTGIIGQEVGDKIEIYDNVVDGFNYGVRMPVGYTNVGIRGNKAYTSGTDLYLVVNPTNNYRTSAGAPSVTPYYIGEDLLDTTNNKWYRANGIASSADWLLMN